MEIGPKIIQKINKLDKNTGDHISIHINENWVVFCLFSKETLVDLNKIRFLQPKSSTFILKTIKKYIKGFSLNELPKSVKLVYYDCTSTLVPTILFEEKNSLNFLKYNSKININDQAANDVVLNDEMRNVFIPFMNINNYIFKKFNAFNFFHYSTLLIDLLFKEARKSLAKKIFLNINDGFIDILFFNNKKIEFYNSFKHSSSEDILYYLLFSLSQLNLNPDNIHVVTSGNISLDSDIYELLYKYVRNIEILNFESIEEVNPEILTSNILFRNL